MNVFIIFQQVVKENLTCFAEQLATVNNFKI